MINSEGKETVEVTTNLIKDDEKTISSETEGLRKFMIVMGTYCVNI